MTPGLGRDFRWLWAATAVSELGGAVSSGALPLIAVSVLHVPVWQVALLATLSALAGAALCLPLGAVLDRRRRRPAMIVADLIRCAATASIPLTAVIGDLSYPQLCVVGVVNTGATIAFTAASGAHLKTLLPPVLWQPATARFESTFWAVNSVGPAIGGALIGAFGVAASLAADAVSFGCSALALARIRSREPAPAGVAPGGWVRRDMVAGWRCILARPPLAALFWNSLLFGGSIMSAGTLTAVLLLRDLGLSPFEYGVTLAVPCLAGTLASALAPHLTRRFGVRLVLLGSGVLRSPWLLLVPLATTGRPGMLTVIAADSGLLFAAGIFNPTFAVFRLRAVPDDVTARVLTAWAVSSRTAQPLAIATGGALAAALGLRPALWISAAACLLSALLLPWRSAAGPSPQPAEP